MANKKFSEFELKTTTSNVSHIVGYNGAENVRITPANFLDTTGGPYLPLAGGTMVGNLIVDDNVQIQVGTTGDLRIYHDGSNSYINDTGTGNLRIRATDFRLESASLIQNFLIATETAGVQLFFNDLEKFKTTNTGISVTGDGLFSGDVTIDNASGDPFLKLKTAAQEYVLRIDQSDSEKFQIRNATSSVTALSIDTSGNSTFASTVIATSDSNAKGISILGRASDDISELNFYENDGTTLLSRLQTRTSYFFIGSITSIPMLFGIGGVEKMRLDASGNLGIGTSSPSTSLDILSTSSSPIRIIRNVNDSNVAINYTDTAGTNWYAGKSGLNHFSIGIAPNLSTNTFFNLTTAGNLGIGTSTPSEKLTVVGGAASRPTFVHQSGYGGIQICGSAAGSSAALLFSNDYNNTITPEYSIVMDGSNDGLAFVSGDPNDIGTLERMRISAAGDIDITSGGVIKGMSYLELKNNGGTVPSATSPRIYSPASGTLGFAMNGGEKMRITSGGDLLINTASTPDGSSAYGSGFIKDNVGRAVLHMATSTTSAASLQVFFNPNGVVGSISTNGSATSFTTSSDYRLKEDLQDFKGLDLVSKIPVYDYKWKSSNDRGYGVMAHQLQEVLPQAVTGEKDAEEMQSVDYSKIVPLLVKSIQELSAKLEALECQCEKK